MGGHLKVTEDRNVPNVPRRPSPGTGGEVRGEGWGTGVVKNERLEWSGSTEPRRVTTGDWYEKGEVLRERGEERTGPEGYMC